MSSKKNDIRFQVIGDVSRFSDKLQEKIRAAEQLTENNTGMVLSVAANYGGRWDIANAAKQLAVAVANQEMQLNDIDENALDRFTSLTNMPDLRLDITKILEVFQQMNLILMSKFLWIQEHMTLRKMKPKWKTIKISSPTVMQTKFLWKVTMCICTKNTETT